jgi:hypothetical protein
MNPINFIFHKKTDLDKRLECDFKTFISTFNLQDKRIKNFLLADSVAIARDSQAKIIGVVFVTKKIKFMNNVTWLVSKDFRGLGISDELLRMTQKHYFILTALARNKQSLSVARRNNFFIIFNKFCFWFSYLVK